MLSINVFVHTLMPTESSGYCTNFAICGHCVELHAYKNPFNYLFKCGREEEAHVFLQQNLLFRLRMLCSHRLIANRSIVMFNSAGDFNFK